MEASGYTHWFEKMLAERGHELWLGDAARIRAAMVRKSKTGTRDAFRIIDLLLSNRFPRIWIPTPADRDARQLPRHRHKLVCLRTWVRNQLHALALGQGVCRKTKRWRAAGRKAPKGLALGRWAARHRKELLEILDRLDMIADGGLRKRWRRLPLNASSVNVLGPLQLGCPDFDTARP